MNAEPLLLQIARALSEAGLEAVLIGNAAAALQGAPVTTLDFDFCFRSTAANERKIRDFAQRLGATWSKPGAPVSQAIRVEREADNMQVDFLPDKAIDARWASLRSKATRVQMAGHAIWVADIRDVASGKRKAGRPKDKASLYAIEATIEEKDRQSGGGQEP